VATPSPKKPLNIFQAWRREKVQIGESWQEEDSVWDSGFLDEQTETDNEDVDIQEFDEDDLPIPERGSFSMNPSPSHLKSSKQHLLVRHNSDNDTDDIFDSSPGKTLSCSLARPDKLMRKVATCPPSLPCLTSIKVLNVYNLPMDYVTLAIVIWNFGLVVTISIYWKAPLVL
jgi:hypothetical protein